MAGLADRLNRLAKAVHASQQGQRSAQNAAQHDQIREQLIAKLDALRNGEIMLPEPVSSDQERLERDEQIRLILARLAKIRAAADTEN